MQLLPAMCRVQRSLLGRLLGTSSMIDVLETVKAVRFRVATNLAMFPAVQLLKFTGCYHGHADSFLVQAGSGVLTLGLPDSPGVPKTSTGATGQTIVAVQSPIATQMLLLDAESQFVLNPGATGKPVA